MTGREYREAVLQCLGDFPAPVAPDMETVRKEELGTHTRLTVRYSVEENERIEAYLLLPQGHGCGNLPAVVACHQHAGEYWLGKSEPAGLSANEMYHYGLDLCLRGYAVLCPDHLCFEDRRPKEFRRRENPALEGGNYERFVFTERILRGSTLQAKYLSDLMRGVDALRALDCVDAGRIGAVGHSLGGQEALWLMWADERICAAVSCCGFSQIGTILRDGVNHNFAMYAPGLLKRGDIAELVCSLAPRPFLMANGDADAIFPLDGVREIAARAAARYAAAGTPGNFRSVVFPGGHGFPDGVKAQAYAFLDEHLKR